MTTFRTYTYKQYQYGWMVVSTELDGRDEKMEMCFANEASAISHTAHLNMWEADRVAKANEREAAMRAKMVIPSSPYYSITGYYGD